MMRGFVCVLVCVAVNFAAHTQAQVAGHGHASGNAAATAGQNPNGIGRCRPRWTEYNGNCYLYESGAILPGNFTVGTYTINNQEGLTQDEANLYCASLHPGATLVTINNKAENDFIYDWAVRTMTEPISAWIGLHAHPTPTMATQYEWQWFDQTVPAIYQNWRNLAAPLATAGLGVVIFDADLLNIPANGVEISEKWLAVDALGMQAEAFGLICEHSLSGTTTNMPTEPPSTTTTTPTMAPATTGAATTKPTTTAGAIMLNNNPSNLMNVLRGGAFGGSQLHEVPRRPASYRMNPFYAVRP